MDPFNFPRKYSASDIQGAPLRLECSDCGVIAVTVAVVVAMLGHPAPVGLQVALQCCVTDGTRDSKEMVAPRRTCDM